MEEAAKLVTIYVSHALEIISAIVIGFAVVKLTWNFFSAFRFRKNSLSAEEARIKFGSSVSVSLELLLGADVLATAVAPSWDAIGKLAAIAVLRTALNYFLAKELKEIKEHAQSSA